MNYVLIIGAKSDIAKELARIYAMNNFNLILAGREINSLNDLSQDLKIRYKIDVQLVEFNITDFESHESFFNDLIIKPVGIILSAGFMTDQKVCEIDFDKSLNTINVNYVGAVSILNIFANLFEQNKNGFIIGISSVAGDRGRKANYIYGSAKAGFSAYLSGLRNRLYKSNVHVLTVKPGFVYTKMTEHLNLPEKLTAQPDEIAKDIFHAQQINIDVLYSKWLWKYIMLIIKHIPETIFKKLNI